MIRDNLLHSALYHFFHYIRWLFFVSLLRYMYHMWHADLSGQAKERPVLGTSWKSFTCVFEEFWKLTVAVSFFYSLSMSHFILLLYIVRLLCSNKHISDMHLDNICCLCHWNESIHKYIRNIQLADTKHYEWKPQSNNSKLNLSFVLLL